MDEIVKQAMAKWPDVPHCYGWLALDARGGWRMRDDRTQALGLPGDRITHGALQSFINRNYLCDERGRWYFQNGPQRVYVNLEATPYIARTDPMQGFILHTGEPLPFIDAAWMTDAGQLILKNGWRVAMLDDRDIAQCMADLRVNGEPAGDEQLVAWLNRQSDDELTLHQASREVPVQHLANDAIAEYFGFVRVPQPDA